jgi:adenylate kinase family enzyme
MYNNMPYKQPFIRDINIIVEKVRIEGNGVILLTGPSGCGKGEIAKALRKFLSIPEEKHLSMGDILRKTIVKARDDKEFRNILADKYKIGERVSIFDEEHNKLEIIRKAENHKQEIFSFLGISNDFVSQLDWLEFCVKNGLLVPDELTDRIIEALFEGSPELSKGILILDGYPRTPQAAQSLLDTFSRLGIPIIKVIHLFITKEQMKFRGLNRNRLDDNAESLERRYHFYIEKVQPCIDYLKSCLGTAAVALIDAHQPVYNKNKELDIEASIHRVVLSVMDELGLPSFLLDIK